MVLAPPEGMPQAARTLLLRPCVNAWMDPFTSLVCRYLARRTGRPAPGRGESGVERPGAAPWDVHVARPSTPYRPLVARAGCRVPGPPRARPAVLRATRNRGTCELVCAEFQSIATCADL